MPTIKIALCTVQLDLSGVETLREKRSIIQSMMARMHNTFNVSAAEIDHLDTPDSSVIAFAVVTNATHHGHSTISTVLKWIEKHVPDVEIVDQSIEII